MTEKKKVLICGSTVPFVRGGAELLVEGLARAVGEAGYRVDTVSFPYQWDPPEKIMESCLAWRLFKPDESPADKPDLVVATKFPSYAIDHPNKVAWVLHQHRSAYDLKDTIYDDFTRYDGAEGYRDLIRDIDRKFLSECKRVFTISKLVSSRIKEFCGKESEVVYHPPPLNGRYESGDYGNDVLVVGRMEPLKRVDLAIKAMKYVKSGGARLRVIGRGFLEEPLKELAQREGVGDVVSFDGFVGDGDLISLYAGAGCVVYVPYQEDYGYSTIEAFKSRKPAIVATDSGGPLEFVTDNENGLVVPPEPEEVARAIDGLLGNRKKAKRFGRAGFEAVEDLSWDGVIEKIIAPFVAT